MLPIKRTNLERFDVPQGDYETVIMLVEVPPQVNTGLHTHPGFDAAYLIEGDLTVLVQGQPSKPIKPGDSSNNGPAYGTRGRASRRSSGLSVGGKRKCKESKGGESR